jgi:hypothetical protein
VGSQSFHFSPRLPGKDWGASEAAHEARLAALLQLGPGKKCLDVGCGVGGPMRTIASTSGAHVTGITINDYQVSRATYHNQRVRRCPLPLLCLLTGLFLRAPHAVVHTGGHRMWCTQAVTAHACMQAAGLLHLWCCNLCLRLV